MRIVDFPQGSAEWLAHRRTTRNASEAPIIMGASPYVTRAELIRQRATGVEREIDAATQYVFDKGHAVEPLLRTLAEALIEDDFYPVTAVSDDGYLGASFDGVTLAENCIFEAKQSNAGKMDAVARDEIPQADYWQIVHQFAVCETATDCLYAVGDGTEAGTRHMLIPRARVEADIPRLLAGWAQFDADVADYVPEPAAEPSALQVRARTEALPVVSARVDGQVIVIDNFPAVEARVFAFLEHDLIRSPQTDEDFIALDDQIKAMKTAEAQLAAAGDQILAQIEAVDSAMRRKDKLAALLRENRLLAEKLMSTEKDRRRREILDAGAAAVRAHFDTINATLGAHAFQPAQSLTLDLGAAIKGKRTLSSMRDAIDSAVAREKIEASQRAERVRACIAIIEQHAEHRHLFADAVQLCATKQPDDLRNLVAARVAEHQKREADRIEAERERIRKEEADRLEREQQERDRQQQASQRAEAAPAPVQPAPAPVVVQQAANTQPARAAPADSGARIALGDICARIAPLTITAAGLAQLGFQPVATERSAKLYAAGDFRHICDALHGVVSAAAAQAQAA